MDLQKKFKSFIQVLKTPTSPEAESMPFEIDHTSPTLTKFKEHIGHSEFANDPQVDRELIESIEASYYSDDSFDASQHELGKLPEALDRNMIENDGDRLRKQLKAVSKKVSELVLENHPAYAAELQRVMELQESLQKASIICANGRRQLSLAKQGFTTASLALLANYRKRQQLIALLKSLHTIKTLQRTDIRLREMLEEEHYPAAIQLCLECQKAASTFKHYKCISELSSKLQDTLEMIEEQLDVALSKTCNNFDTKHYEKVQTAYKLLGKTQTAMDQLHMHFASAIHNTAFTIVLGYVELCSGTAGSNFQKRTYSDLCKNITVESFTPCLTDLCKALWEVMKAYHKTMEWHENSENSSGSAPAISGHETEASGSNVEASFNRRYIKQKLEHGLGRIWQDVQQKVKTYVLSTDLSYFKYDEFIQVLDIINSLIQIGEEFCGSKSEALQDSIRKQSLNYFRNYHRARLDELRMFLENEGWELCPVKSTFSILQLQEFKFMRHLRQQTQKASVSSSSSSASQVAPPSPKVQPKDSPSHSRTNYGYFEKFGDSGNPFDVLVEEEEKEDVLVNEDEGNRSFEVDSDSDEDVPDELKQDFVDERTGEAPVRKTPSSTTRRSRSFTRSGKMAPIITNTTLNVCRVFGKYMQMMSVLKPISFDVIFCMSQIFDYYLYTVYSFFGTDMIENERILSSKLRTTLKRIHDNLILEEESNGVSQSPASDEQKAVHDKVGHPHLSPIVELGSGERLFGLAERTVAAESLVFLSEQLEFLQPTLDLLIPQTKRAFLQQFYSQTVSTAQELRKPVYRTVAYNAVNFDQLFNLMAAVKWDIKDIMSQNSSYVDVVLRELQVFSGRLTEVTKARVPIPKVVYNILWDHCIGLACHMMVEGYANAKKCTNEGRALMQVDFQHFLMKVEKLTDLRPIPEREFVEVYIKAYYLPEAQLEDWIKEHREYTSKQLIALVGCISHINKKARQRLISIVEDMDKYRR